MGLACARMVTGLTYMYIHVIEHVHVFVTRIYVLSMRITQRTGTLMGGESP